MTAQFNADILTRLGDLTRDELRSALSAIRADAAAFKDEPVTEDSVAKYNTLVEAARSINAQLANLDQLAATSTAQFAELDDLTAPAASDSGDTATTATTDGDNVNDGRVGDGSTPGNADAQAALNKAEDDDAKADDKTSGDTTPDGDDNTGADDDTKEGGPVTASGRRPLGNGATTPAIARLPQIKSVTTVAGGIDGHSPGARLDRRSLAEAFRAKAMAVSGRGVSGFERYTVATVRSEFPEERMLHRSADPFANIERIEDVAERASRLHARDNASNRVQVRSGLDGEGALTAAGLCAPLENLYDIRTIGDTDRPVRDALVRFGADRGGIQWRPALDGVTQTGGIGVWSEANDEASPLVPKTCVEIACPGLLTAVVDAIYQCLTFSNMSTRFDPEWMDSTIKAQAIAHARFAENRLLGQLTTASKDIYGTRLLGATRDILFTLDAIIAYYRNVHRLADEVSLRWIAPLWAKYLMRADITRQMVGDGLQSLAITDAMLNGWLAERNINVTWHLDGIDPADFTVPAPDIVVPAQYYTLAINESALPAFPTSVSSLLFAEGDWLHLDGGTLDLGVVRDSTLNGQNRFQTFSESFEVPAFRGIESIHLVIPALPTGESAATANTAVDTVPEPAPA